MSLLTPSGKDMMRILSDSLPEAVPLGCDDYHEFCERGRMDLDRVIFESWREAYRCLFEARPDLARIDREYRIVYSPSSHLRVSRYLYVYGVDKYGFGYNVVGGVLEELLYGRAREPEPTLVYLCHRCLALLDHRLDHGLDVLECCDRTVPEILQTFGLLEPALKEESLARIAWERFRGGGMSVRETRLIRQEMDHPGSLARAVRAEKSAVFNQKIAQQEERVLLESAVRLLEKKHGRTVRGLRVPPSLMDRLRKVLSGSTAVRRELESLHPLSPEELEKAGCDLPRFRPCAHGPPILVLSENNEPIGPLAHQSLVYADREFCSVQHLAVFLILDRIGHPDPYAVVHDLDFRRGEADGVIDAHLLGKKESAIRSWLDGRANEPSFRKALMTRDPVPTPLGRVFDLVVEQKRKEMMRCADCRLWRCISRAGLRPDDLFHARIVVFLDFFDRVCSSFRWKKSARTVGNILRFFAPGRYDGLETEETGRVLPWHDPRADGILGLLFRRWQRDAAVPPRPDALAAALAPLADSRPEAGTLLAGLVGSPDEPLSREGKKALKIFERRGTAGAEALARVVQHLVDPGTLRRLTGL
jgi:hypothetical protein